MRTTIPISYHAGVTPRLLLDVTDVDIEEVDIRETSVAAVWRPCTRKAVEYRSWDGRLWYSPWETGHPQRHDPHVSQLRISTLELESRAVLETDPGHVVASFQAAVAASLFSPTAERPRDKPLAAGRGRYRPHEAQRAIRTARRAAEHMRVMSGRLWIETVGPALQVTKSDPREPMRLSLCRPEEVHRLSVGAAALDHDPFLLFVMDRYNVVSEIADLRVMDEAALDNFRVDAAIAENFAHRILGMFATTPFRDLGPYRDVYLRIRFALQSRTEGKSLESAEDPAPLLWCDSRRELPGGLMADLVELRDLLRIHNPQRLDHGWGLRFPRTWYEIHDKIWSKRVYAPKDDLDIVGNIGFS